MVCGARVGMWMRMGTQVVVSIEPRTRFGMVIPAPLASALRIGIDREKRPEMGTGTGTGMGIGI